jgi:cytoskeletal protein CcmA (bactofilin family)
MLRSDTLFGKREGNTLNPAMSTTSSSALGQTSTSAARPVSPTSTLAQPDSAKTSPALSSLPATGIDEAGSKLIVGPNIKLKGVEITDCDTIVVEGLVEATIFSRVIQIAEQGAFKGAAEIDIAEIRGAFDGELTVRQKLVIFSTGKVSGKIRYGKLVIEEGGQLSGDVQMDLTGSHAPGSPKALLAAKLGE